jgi:dTDP-glucose pyrophosphorylase
MIGIIPAAGKGTRLGEECKPLTDVNGKYLIEYPLQNMFELGIKEVIIIQNGTEIEDEIGDFWNGIKIMYSTQEEKEGSAKAIYLATECLTEPPEISNEDYIVILGDVIFDGDLTAMKKAFYRDKLNCLCGGQIAKNKEEIKKSYGITMKGKFIEKPQVMDEISNVLGLGIFMFDKSLFEKIAITPINERKNEYDIIDTINLFEKNGFFVLRGYYNNINTQEELKEAQNYFE